MMERLTRALAGTVRAAARLLPPGRRQWGEAVQAEAAAVAAGWPRLHWLAGGLWLVLREANVGRKICNWLGVGVVTAAAAWAVWLSWRTASTADGESAADRFRILVGAAALVGLPWLGRRRGLCGPVGSTLTARLVRVAGCAVGLVAGAAGGLLLTYSLKWAVFMMAIGPLAGLAVACSAPRWRLITPGPCRSAQAVGPPGRSGNLTGAVTEGEPPRPWTRLLPGRAR